MSALQVRVTSRTKDGQETFQGTATIPGLKPTKIVKKKDGCSEFSTVSAVRTSARSIAKTLGFEGVELDVPVKKAAKRTAKK